MHRFKDKNETAWSISVNVQSVEEMRHIGFNVRELLRGQDEIQKLYDDQFLIVDILTVLTKEQRADRNISVNDFFTALEGPQLDEATKAFIAALVDFFQPRQRALLVATLAKMDEAYETATTLLTAEIQNTNLTPMIESEVANLAESFQTIST